MHRNIFFAHGNGFPSSCYRKMFRYLLDDYHLSYIDTIGHEAEYPVTDNWELLAKQLIHRIERFHVAPVIGVGHSLGGVLHFLAACQRPDLFQAIILLDAPILGSGKSFFLRFLKKISLIDYITPAHKTKNRKTSWETKEALYQYLKSKPIFANFDEDCLKDYMTYGMLHHENQIQLRFKREIEWQIYRTLPHHLAKVAPSLSVKAGLIYGEDTNIVKQKDIQYMQNVLNFMVMHLPGGHLFPFEHPEHAARLLKEMIQRLTT